MASQIWSSLQVIKQGHCSECKYVYTHHFLQLNFFLHVFFAPAKQFWEFNLIAEKIQDMILETGIEETLNHKE